MKDNTLLWIALVGSIVGLAALYFIASNIPPNEVTINLEQHEINEDVKLKGKITKITEKNGITMLNMEQQTTVPLIMFKEQQSVQQMLEEGSIVEVTGKVSDYKGKKEVIATSIKKI